MVIEFIIGIFENMISFVPEEYRFLVSFGLYTIFIVLYSIFIWKFYKFLSSRDIIGLNLRQYNRSSHPGLEKFFATLLYIIEYMVILPFLVLFWFTILSLFLILLSESESVMQILMISAAIIASIRITCYINQDLSKDIAKILPFTVLAMFIIGADFFNLDKLIARFSEIPQLIDHIFIFIVILFVIEFVFRIIYSIIKLFQSSEEEA